MNVATADLDTLREELLALPTPALERHLRSLNDDDLDAVTLAFRRPRLLPHQIPPPGDWWLWILEGGRGSGKSQASSVWFDQHMTGPPCDDRLPGGHRGLIAAPTGADAVQSCYEGPSGLKVLNPSVRIATSRSGTNVYWPNGAQAVLLGAHGPDDIERFRAAGNRCLAAGTPVVTRNGTVPVEAVRVGDDVWTRQGWRRTLRAGTFGAERLWRVALDTGQTARCSWDHPWWVVGAGWTRTADIVEGQEIATWVAAADIVEPSGSGKPLTDRSRPECTSITATTTRATTASRTSSYSLPPNTGIATTPNEAPTGIAEAPALLTPSGRPGRSSASSAGPRSRPGRTKPGSARIVAPTTDGPEPKRAPRGETSGATIATDPSPRGMWALGSVVACAETEERGELHCLKVDGAAEFVAGGMLSSNCAVWSEELAAWRQLEKAWQVMDLGVRAPSGRLPQFVASTTPKPRKFLKELRARPGVARTHGRTSQNPFLDAERRAQLYATYGGTRMGMQELEGLYIDDVEGALWSLEQLEATRVGRLPDDLRRVVIGVDPPGSTAECGIVAAGVGVTDRHLYVFADYSLVGSPATWGAKVVEGYHDARADKICVERNYGGDMVRNTIRTAQGGESLPIKDVSATRGKVVRAEPVAALFEVERHGGPRAHIVGHLPGLEEQLTNWVPNEGQTSPDRLDAMVWAATELMPGMLHRPGKATGRQIAEARLDV